MRWIIEHMLRYLLTFVLLVPAGVFSQTLVDSIRVHRNFHLELSLGPAWSSIHDDVASHLGPIEQDITGMGFSYELRLGWFVIPNLALTADLAGTDIYNPQLETTQESYLSGMSFTTHTPTFGTGITWYKMPANFFAGFSLGIGKIYFHQGSSLVLADLETGSFWNLRLGKHWWISDNWGISCTANYGRTEAKSDPSIHCDVGGGYLHDMRSSRISLMVGIGLR